MGFEKGQIFTHRLKTDAGVLELRAEVTRVLPSGEIEAKMISSEYVQLFLRAKPS